MGGASGRVKDSAGSDGPPPGAGHRQPPLPGGPPAPPRSRDDRARAAASATGAGPRGEGAVLATYPTSPPRRATIDVAAAAGVSRAAVSKVTRHAYGVSDDMRRRVGEAVKDLGYRPRVAAQAMRGSTSTIGVMIPLYRTSFFDDVLTGVVAELSATPFQLIQAPVDPRHIEGYRALEALYDRQVDGIIAVSPLVEPQWLEDLAQRIPVVELGRHDASRHYDTVVGDDAVGARLVMDHLLERGHRRIAHLTQADPVTAALDTSPHGLRRVEYEAAMRRAGLGEHVQVIAEQLQDRPAEVAVRAALETGPRPTALFAGNDNAAVGALRAIAELGLTTADIAVCGYDDNQLSSHPLISLTSVDQQGVRMGRCAAELLRERIAGRREARHEVLEPHLVVRASTLRARPTTAA